MAFLLTIHIFVTLSLIGIILLQRGDTSGGILGSGSQKMFSARGASNFLTKLTAILAALFIANCILMTMFTSASIRQSTKLFDTKDDD
ncbi:MAG: preprotein translocase subunit SecG [Alphaproteobacteria bacterium]